jgi:two-component system NtrC family sensor kinase
MLIFARQTGGNFSREYIHNLVESSLMLVNHKLELKNIKLVKSFKCDQDYVDCDAGQVRQALVALFVNAIEAMDENDQLTVRICCEENQTVRLEIEDTGYGIPDDILPNIFDPFFSTKKDGHGVGLGLAVVYGIIQRHKGDIQVKSEVNRGTIFIITLPRKPIPDSVDITDQTITEM